MTNYFDRYRSYGCIYYSVSNEFNFAVARSFMLFLPADKFLLIENSDRFVSEAVRDKVALGNPPYQFGDIKIILRHNLIAQLAAQ